jgi:hypothetical protein
MDQGIRITTTILGPYLTEPILPGHYLPERWRSVYDDIALPVMVTVEMRVMEGAPRCLAVAQTPREAIGQWIFVEEIGVLELPLERIVEEVITATTVSKARAEMGIGPYVDPEFAGSAPFDAAQRTVQRELAQRRRIRITDEYLAEVAKVYREAFERGDPPTVAVQASFGLTRSTAGRHVGLAREGRFLNPAREGVAGEIEKEEQDA